MENTARFWNMIAKLYAKNPVADEAAYQKKLHVSRNYFRPDMHVLEFGCGTGSTAIAHAPFVQHILAIDFSSRMIEIAKEKAAAQHITNVEFVCATLDGIPAPRPAYDAVLGLNVLHLMRDWQEVIRKVHAMLPADGVFITSTQCMGDAGILAKALSLVSKAGAVVGLMPTLAMFTPKQLKDALLAAGFTIDHTWQPAPNKPIFIVAKKSA